MKRAVLERLQAARSAKRPAALITDLASGRQALVADGGASGDLPLKDYQVKLARDAIAADRSGPFDDDAGLFLQVFNPPLRLIVVGAVHITQALAPMAEIAGYEVILIDPRKAWASAERFPQGDAARRLARRGAGGAYPRITGRPWSPFATTPNWTTRR